VPEIEADHPLTTETDTEEIERKAIPHLDLEVMTEAADRREEAPQAIAGVQAAGRAIAEVMEVSRTLSMEIKAKIDEHLLG